MSYNVTQHRRKMSRKQRKMLNAAINTDSVMFDESTKDNLVKPSRLKERDVKQVKITHSAELHDVYNFGEQIGHGSFGTVISVVDKLTEKDWAMKIVNKTTAGDKLQSLQREIHILKMVDHPHIIYLDKVYESAKKIYLILERCYGELAKVYKETKPFSEVDTRKVIRDLANAVAYLHKNDIVHRDLKLENILMAKNPCDIKDKLYIKITDFGLSIVKQGSGYEDMLHDCCGTLMYMAPEVITNRSYSQQCDVWAIGVIMFMLLRGHFPFFSSNEQELTTMICKTEPSYSALTVSTEAIHLVSKMLAKNPALRITAAEVVLHPWISGKPMTHEKDSPENVLDMMRLWRSEMMLPVGDECDWVSSARAAGSSTEFYHKGKSSTAISSQIFEENSEEPNHDEESGSDNATTRRQSMRLPVKNIRFDRSANETSNKLSRGRGTGRRASIAVGVEDSSASRRGNTPSSLYSPATSKQSRTYAVSRTQHSSGIGRTLPPPTPDKGKKKNDGK